MAPAMEFQTDVGPPGQANMVTLGNFQTKRTSLNSGKLLQAAMLVLNQPGPIRIGGASDRVQVQTAGGPIFRVAVWGNGPKYFNQSIAAQMHDPPGSWNV